jgi:hypothetical protein
LTKLLKYVFGSIVSLKRLNQNFNAKLCCRMNQFALQISREYSTK